jgi:hypothetical protein
MVNDNQIFVCLAIVYLNLSFSNLRDFSNW